jgi:hypothetical protein
MSKEIPAFLEQRAMPFLVPIVERTLPGSAGLRQMWIFLERNGGHMLEIESPEAAEAFLAENELNAGSRGIQQSPNHPGLIFVDIDSSDKDLAQFYTWREVMPGTVPSREVWRPFLWVTTETGWDVNRLLEEVQLGPDQEHTAFKILEAYLALP